MAIGPTSVTPPPVTFPKDANGWPVQVLGHYGSNQSLDEVGDDDQPSEVYVITAARNVARELTADANFGKLTVGEVYEIRTAGALDTDRLLFRYAEKNAAAPNVTAGDAFWPIGRLPVFQFRCLSGQEQMAVLVASSAGAAFISLQISHCR